MGYVTLAFIINKNFIDDSLVVPILKYRELGKAIKDGCVVVSERRAKQILRQFKKIAEQEIKKKRLDYIDIGVDRISVRGHNPTNGYLTFYEEVRILKCENDEIRRLLDKWANEVLR